MSWKQALSSLGLHQSCVWGLWAPTSLLGIPGEVTAVEEQGPFFHISSLANSGHWR